MAVVARLWQLWRGRRPWSGHYNVYGWNRYLRYHHPQVGQECDIAAHFCATRHTSEEILHTVVRAVESDRYVIAVVTKEPGSIRFGCPPYHLVGVNRGDGACEEMTDEPPYCFFGIK
jgi:hypothetical protein